jgi:hypothetical protein
VRPYLQSCLLVAGPEPKLDVCTCHRERRGRHEGNCSRPPPAPLRRNSNRVRQIRKCSSCFACALMGNDARLLIAKTRRGHAGRAQAQTHRNVVARFLRDGPRWRNAMRTGCTRHSRYLATSVSSSEAPGHIPQTATTAATSGGTLDGLLAGGPTPLHWRGRRDRRTPSYREGRRAVQAAGRKADGVRLR